MDFITKLHAKFIKFVENEFPLFAFNFVNIFWRCQVRDISIYQHHLQEKIAKLMN